MGTSPTPQQAAEILARYAVVLMERGVLRPSRGLSTAAITVTLDRARSNPDTRAAFLVKPSDRAIRAAFKTSTPPAVS